MIAAQRREIERLARLAADPEACIVELRRRVEALEIARALAKPAVVCHNLINGDAPPLTTHPLMTSATRFQVGQTYYGSLACSHGHFPVICIKRTAKCVWFEHAIRPEHYPAARCKIHDYGTSEAANFRRWYISSDQYDTSMDMQFA